jgi:translation initiation factor IF-2
MDNTENKPKKLGLKLKSNLDLDTKDLAKDYISFKTSSLRPEKLSQNKAEHNFLGEDKNAASLTNDEITKRLDVLKRAAQEKESIEQLDIEISHEVEQQISAQLPEEIAPKLDDVALEGPSIDHGGTKPHEVTPAQDAQEKSSQDAKAKKLPDVKIFGAKAAGDSDDSKIAKPVAKLKYDATKKLKKYDIYNLLEKDESFANAKFNKRGGHKNKSKFNTSTEKVVKEVEIYNEITVADLANKMSERAVDVIKELMKLGVMADANKLLDIETIELLVSAFGHKFKRIEEVTVNSILANEIEDSALLKPRPPVVTIMGHVDHGKTSLLDAIRSTDVALKEFGGITQNIGAYQVNLFNGAKITFIDTPGHEAFTAMRSRGAQVTDIVILVVAVDDGINEQTIEAINHAKAANLPIIVAVNKIDKLTDYSKGLTAIKNEMLMHNLIAEDMGGDVMFVPVSALKKINLDKLEEAITLMAELMELKANYDGTASGIVLDSRLDKHEGSLATLLVTRGTLKLGDLIVAGSTYGKIRKMYDYKGELINLAEPSTPVSVIGLEKIAHAGDKFMFMSTEKQAREISESYSHVQKEKRFASLSAVQNSLDPFAKDVKKELAIIIKADSQGSLEAIVGSLSKISHAEVGLKILHRAVGGINESDVSLADASNAVILAFNVRASNLPSSSAKNAVDIRYYSIIYDLINDVKDLLSGMLAPNIREEYLGNAEIRQVFNITKVGKVAGCYITKGLARRGASMRLLREDIVIHEGKLKTLKRFKEDVKEVKEGFECGIVFENYENIQIGDQVEIFTYIEEKRASI